MRAWLLVVAAASCTAPDVDGFDLVVGTRQVIVYPRYRPSVARASESVPDLGACAIASYDDTPEVDLVLSEVRIDGVEILWSGDGEHYPVPIVAAGGVSDATVFRATDAGVEIAVPIHAPPFPSPGPVTASGDQTHTMLRWETDAPTVLIRYYGLGASGSCRIAGSAGAYDIAGYPVSIASTSYSVTALSAPEITQTELGTVRVFYGELEMP